MEHGVVGEQARARSVKMPCFDYKGDALPTKLTALRGSEFVSLLSILTWDRL